MRLDLAWISGAARLAEWRGGRSALLGFTRVRPAQAGVFQPLRHEEITPRQLDRLIRALRRWKLDIVSLDEACARLASRDPGRFVSLGFDGRHRDVPDHAAPVLSAHGVPYTVYVPPAFPDGIAEPWWLALEAVIARNARVSLMIDRREQRFMVHDPAVKQQLFDYLSDRMRTFAPDDLRSTLHDLCGRYAVNLPALVRDSALTWRDIAALAADPNVTIGSATVSFPLLTTLPRATAMREIAMGRSVLATALQRPVKHFAYPFGDAQAFTPQHRAMVREAGFDSAVTAIDGTLDWSGPLDHDALPRLMWDARRATIRRWRVLLSGAVQV